MSLINYYSVERLQLQYYEYVLIMMNKSDQPATVILATRPIFFQPAKQRMVTNTLPPPPPPLCTQMDDLAMKKYFLTRKNNNNKQTSSSQRVIHMTFFFLSLFRCKLAGVAHNNSSLHQIRQPARSHIYTLPDKDDEDDEEQHGNHICERLLCSIAPTYENMHNGSQFRRFVVIAHGVSVFVFLLADSFGCCCCCSKIQETQLK